MALLSFYAGIAGTLFFWNMTMPHNIWIFAVLAVFTNTWVPVPFETILFYYHTKYPDSTVLLVVIGSVCAAIGALIDLGLAASIRKKVFTQETVAGFRFYSIAFLFALAPLPFSVIRASLLRIRPNPALYAAAILPGRFFRYFLLTTSIRSNGVSTAMMIGAIILFIAWISERYYFANRRIPFGALP
jgi:hypothetical protein